MEPKKRWKIVLGIILLAIFCIGGMELLVCRFAAPELYEQITAPVRRQAVRLWDGTVSLALAARDTFTDLQQQAAAALEEALHPEEEEPLEDQSAGEAATVETLHAADPTITEFTDRDGQEILTGGSYEIVYFNQGDELWSSRPYGSDTLGRYGCGPTAMAMAAASMTDAQTDPEQMAASAVSGGYWARRGGSYLSIVGGLAESYGLVAESAPGCDADQLRLELASGKIAVALMTKGHFTKGGHFILLRGTTLDGGILVADPNSRERSLAIWDAQLILDELSPSRSNGAPLWFLSPKPEGLPPA